ncbi:MAG TPA: hemolysin family protein [Candidatus Hydrogenedentes bacterium]|nr:hemolysin family protein [Candidatus Hydrogenedentota bacterium]HOV73841.1 hemolysin family protein [Candidatus Hydrogenedentota bacterium]HPC14936.1 hemolysin family protein [Candidatus Hydrogenedentota bacterium]HRT18800.1 hemolysin family protein [Candidatus Hydrogenedentota bacterium]HRT65754.1 hemolysin family protein [Candidatus Hydrogenedentota bacterium]
MVSRRKRHERGSVLIPAGLCALILPITASFVAKADAAAVLTYGALWENLPHFFPANVLVLLGALLVLSALFSSCETAFLAIQKPRLRAMRQEKALTARWVVAMLDEPGRLLTTILVGNLLVNTLIGVMLGSRLSGWFEAAGTGAVVSYSATIAICTTVLLVFGEVLPKVFAIRVQEAYARVAVVPLLAADRLLAPLCATLLRVTDFLFQITHFSAFHAAPYITDEELKTILSDEQTPSAIKEEGRQMIRRILEFHDVSLREILIPRPDVIALSEDATVAEAHAQFREYEFSRIPVYRDDLDHIVGILFAKDLLPSVLQGETSRTVKSLARPAHFVPQTMSVQQFIRNVQRQRSHMAIVVDEYGGTAGIVTLHDAIEQIVGSLGDEGDEEQPSCERVAEGVYRVRGSVPIEELSDLLEIPLEDEEHHTVAGFLMAHMEKVPAAGDTFVHAGVRFTVERVEGKRADTVRVEMAAETEEGPA